MPLDRPLRAPAGAITERVRGAILAQAKRLGISPEDLVSGHARAEFLEDLSAVLADIEERYQLSAGSLVARSSMRVLVWAQQGRISRNGSYDFADLNQLQRRVLAESRCELALLEIPDPEFLTVLEHAAASGPDAISAGMAEQLFDYAGEALRAHGAPYRGFRPQVCEIQR